MKTAKKSHIAKFLFLLFSWQIGFLCFGYQLSTEQTTKQISSFIEEIQEDDENENSTFPIVDNDDPDPEWEKLVTYENNWSITVKPTDHYKSNIPILGYKSLPFSPPELVEHF